MFRTIAFINTYVNNNFGTLISFPSSYSCRVFNKAKGSQADNGTVLKIKNVAKDDEVKTLTGIGSDSGAYYVIVKGNKGDSIDIAVEGEKTWQETTITLEGDMKDVNLLVERNGLTAITGYSVFLEKSLSNTGINALVTLVVICSLYFVFRSDLTLRISKRELARSHTQRETRKFLKFSGVNKIFHTLLTTKKEQEDKKEQEKKEILKNTAFTKNKKEGCK